MIGESKLILNWIPDSDSPMHLSAYSTYKQTVQLQRALRKARRKVAADGWQVARGWGEAGALRARRGALAHAGRCLRLGKSKTELAREGRQIWSTTNGQRAQALYPCVFH